MSVIFLISKIALPAKADNRDDQDEDLSPGIGNKKTGRPFENLLGRPEG